MSIRLCGHSPCDAVALFGVPGILQADLLIEVFSDLWTMLSLLGLESASVS